MTSLNSDNTLTGPGRLNPWNIRLPWLLLAVSLTLNLFVLGGYLYKRGFETGRRDALPRLETQIDKLNLSDAQRAHLEQLRQRIAETQRTMQRELRPIGDAMWGELEKPAPDRDRVATLMDQVIERRATLQHAQMNQIIDLSATLNDEQRHGLISAIRGRLDQFLRPATTPGMQK